MISFQLNQHNEVILSPTYVEKSQLKSLDPLRTVYVQVQRKMVGINCIYIYTYIYIENVHNLATDQTEIISYCVKTISQREKSLLVRLFFKCLRILF